LNEHIIQSVLVLLASSVVAVALVRRFHLSSIIGYLAVGLAVGPHALGLIDESAFIHLLAEIGVVFLLFSIGLEFSIRQFWSMRQVVVGLGGAQVLFSSLIGALVAWLSGIGWAGAIVAGGALAMSSTAIVVKQLDEQLELHSRHGRLALGILLFQDLAVVPFLVAIPILASGELEGIWWQLAFALAKGLLALGIMLAAGRWIMRPWFQFVAASHSGELFTLNVLMVTLAAASVTYSLGLSLALGAFLAGMMLSETEYRHQIETEIRAFRDVLMGVFFVSIGLQLDPRAVLEMWQWVLIMLLGLILGKGLLIMGLTRWAGYESGVAFRTGMVLAQGGEFGFALLALALNRGLLDASNSQAILATVILSMAVAPLLLRYNDPISKVLFAHSHIKRRVNQTRELGWAAREISDHVILCGFGRVGQNLARFLRAEGIEYVALDLDPYIIRDAWEAGEHVFYGDSTHGEILRAAGLMRARMLVVTFADAHTAERIVEEARKRRGDIPILVRTLEEKDIERLEHAGATDIIPEIFESSLLLARILLRRLDVAEDEIDELIERERADRYRSLRGRFQGESEQLREALHSVTLHGNSTAIGKTLRNFDFSAQGVRVEALRRAGIRGEEPDPDIQLEAEDVLVLRGPPEALKRIEEELTRTA